MDVEWYTNACELGPKMNYHNNHYKCILFNHKVVFLLEKEGFYILPLQFDAQQTWNGHHSDLNIFLIV
jgi:hypothetical protein